MIKRLKAMIKELFVPTRLETDTASNRAYRKCCTFIAHICLSAAVMYIVVTIMAAPVLISGAAIVWAYVMKEALDFYGNKDWKDCLEDVIATVVGVVAFSVAALPLIAIVLGLVVFAIHA